MKGLFTQRASVPLPRLELKNGETPVAVPDGQASAVARDLQQLRRTESRDDVLEYLPATTRLTKMAINFRLKQMGIDPGARPDTVETV